MKYRLLLMEKGGDAVIKKRQILTLASITIISFLIGTMFNMNFVVSGDGKGKEKDEDLWKAISELQSKVDSLNDTLTSRIEELEGSLVELHNKIDLVEEKSNQTRTIRFYDPNEHFWNQYEWATLASFTWIPENVTDNSILSVTYFFEYNASINISTEEVYFNIMINGWSYPEPFYISYNHIPVPHGYTWSPVLTLEYLAQTIMCVPYGVKPNAPSYELEFRINVAYGYMNIWVRNINIIITVIDGLPASD